MTTSVIGWQCFIFCYILQPVCTAPTLTSKACYGTPGPSCIRHDISCNNTQKIAIYDAYYTDNTECGLTGLSSCTVNPDNVTERGHHHRFINTELVSLYNTCSTENQCVYPAPWRSSALTFSVVKYQCIEMPLKPQRVRWQKTVMNNFELSDINDGELMVTCEAAEKTEKHLVCYCVGLVYCT